MKLNLVIGSFEINYLLEFLLLFM